MNLIRHFGRLPLPFWVLLAGAALYVTSLAPSVLWGDDAELQRIVVTGEARAIGQSSRASHLLWLAIASGFVKASSWLPLDAAGRTNLVSALAGAATLPIVYAAAVELAHERVRNPRVAGCLAAISLGLSHTFWLLAVRPAVYTLQMLLLALSVWAVLRWRRTGVAGYLIVSTVAVAAALLNHVLILASSLGLVYLAIAVPRPQRARLYLPGILSICLGIVLLLTASGVGVPVVDLVRAVVSYRPYVPSLRDAVLVPGYLAYQYPLSLPLVIWAIRRLWREDRSTALGLLLLYAGNMLLMLFRHHPAMYVRDQFIFYLPSYLPVSLLVGLGGAVFLDRGNRDMPAVRRVRERLLSWRSALVMGAVLSPLVLYPLVAQAAGSLATRLAPARLLPGRDPVSFYLWPAKTSYNGARTYANSAFQVLEPNAIVVADWLPYQTLLFAQSVEQARRDVQLVLINAGGRAQIRYLLQHAGARPLYLADASPPPYYEMEEIRKCFEVSPRGFVYSLTPKYPTAFGPPECRP